VKLRFIVCACVLSGAGSVYAENSVSIVGNYYKERSTRVVSLEVTIRKELPFDGQVEATYLVDQITSASGAFTPEADVAFQEYRNEIRFGLSKRFGDLTPGVRFRYSTESDYTSWGLSAEVAAEFFDKNTRLVGQFTYQQDDVEARGQGNFQDELTTTLVGLRLVQVVLPELLINLCAETQILSGYTENAYRVEMHPRDRNRYALGGGAAYRIVSTQTTIRADYRFYTDSWKLRAHSIGLQFDQQVLPSLAIVPKVRYHGQNGVYFTDLVDGFRTTDPKLFPFSSGFLGVDLLWRLWFFDGSFLDGATIKPSYAVYFSGTRYGTAHIAQLGGYWPF